MKKLFSLFFILFVSFSFGQSKNKEKSPNMPSLSKWEFISCCCNENSNKIYDENTIYDLSEVDVKPEILGRVKKEQFIKDNFRTPIVNGKKIFGRVYVIFVIEKNGTISNLKILRHVGHGTDKEAKRVLQNMPRWNPAKKGGKIVRSIYSMPMIIP